MNCILLDFKFRIFVSQHRQSFLHEKLYHFYNQQLIYTINIEVDRNTQIFIQKWFGPFQTLIFVLYFNNYYIFMKNITQEEIMYEKEQTQQDYFVVLRDHRKKQKAQRRKALRAYKKKEHKRILDNLKNRKVHQTKQSFQQSLWDVLCDSGDSNKNTQDQPLLGKGDQQVSLDGNSNEYFHYSIPNYLTKMNLFQQDFTPCIFN